MSATEVTIAVLGALLLLLLLQARGARPGPVQPMQAMQAVPWSWRKIIRAVEGAAPFGENFVASYQLIDNLPTVGENLGPVTPGQFLPEPELCDRCVPGSRPQPAEAGRVNSLVSTARASRPGEAEARALPGQFPWHVSLLYHAHFYSCSGALLSDRWVLTAANCVHGFAWVLVRLGSFRPGADKERFRATVNGTRVVVHPGYARGVPRNDVAVVRLEEAVETNGYRLPVRLPSPNSFTLTYEGRRAWLSGWGITSKLGVVASSASLGFVVERVLANEQCARTFGNATAPSVLCTTTEGFTEGCAGDSGAPLVVNEGGVFGVFVQVGVLSFVSSAGCTEGRPAGYTRVTSFLRWIQNATGIAPGPDPDTIATSY